MVQLARPAAAEESPRVLARKREILRAAAEVFRRHGLHASGMRDIAAAAGMAVGNLYYYFRDKQELLAFCQEDALAGLHALAQQVRALDLAADAKLYLLVVGHMLRLHEATPGALAHLDVEALAPAARAEMLARRDGYEAAYREVVRQGIESGVFRAADPKVAAATILGALNWTAQWYRPGGPRTARELGEEMATLLVRGLLAAGRDVVAPTPEHVAALAPTASPAPTAEHPAEGASR